MESIISGCGKFNRSKDKDLIEARSALVQAWKDDVERAFEKVDKNLPDMMARHIADICYRESERLKKQTTMERKIGEIFEDNGEWYQTVKSQGKCCSCDFMIDGHCIVDFSSNGSCFDCHRKDKENIIFKKLKKVGEPFTMVGKLYQHYKVFDIDNVCGDGFWCVHNYKAKTLTIEIKQNKEDMEGKTNLYEKQTPLQKLMEIYCDGRMDYNEFEKKVKELYSDKGDDSKPILKPFDLEAAKQGKAVCTRDGSKARIICFDRRLFYKNVSYPILALVERSDGEDDVCGYNEKGKVLIEDGTEYKDDLMMLPEKKEMWINIYNGTIGSVPGGCLYDTEEDAKDAVKGNENYVTTIKVSWEE